LPYGFSQAGCAAYRLQRQERSAGMLFLPGEEGQGLVEYALIITSIAILVMLALLLAGVNLLALYADVTESIGSLLGI
jgi:Flp pilus assembly pilin Flp